MVDYDKTRWFELLTSGSLESIAQELQTSQKTFLLSATNQAAFNQTCIFIAAKDKSESRGDQLLELLIKEGADAAVKDQLNQTAIFYCSAHGHVNQIDMLVKAGADPGVTDTYGQSAMFYASREGNTQVLDKLVRQNGVNINTVDNTGQSALFYACRDGRYEAVKFLVENGINLNQQDKTKQTGLSWAKRNQRQEIVNLLLSNGAIDNTKKKREDAPRRNTKQDKRIKCQLMIVDNRGDKKPASEQDMDDFEAKYPDIAAYWKDPEALAKLEAISVDELEKSRPWEKPAKKLMNNLWRTAHAWIFHEPVDPKKLHIDDYFEIIKQPMDFGTVKKKLQNNAYAQGQDFISDLSLVFSNCRAYNKPGTDAYIMGEQVHDVFVKQCSELNMDQYKSEGYAGPPKQIEEATVPNDVYLPPSAEAEPAAAVVTQPPAEPVTHEAYGSEHQPIAVAEAPIMSETQPASMQDPSLDRSFTFADVTGTVDETISYQEETYQPPVQTYSEPMPHAQIIEPPQDSINPASIDEGTFSDNDGEQGDMEVEEVAPPFSDDTAVFQPPSPTEQQPYQPPDPFNRFY